MSPHRFIPSLVAAACVVAVSACSDFTSEPTRIPPAAYTPPPPSLVTLSGFVRVSDRSGVVLETAEGHGVPLGGAEIERLESVDGAEVEVRGTWDLVEAFNVQDFLVRAVDGRSAMDGVLTEIYADEYFQEELIGYGLRLTRSALVVPLTDPPAELLEHLGERVWVTSGSNGDLSAYGVIGRAADRKN